jgi:polar amino acid transport system substrate-binding protein
LKPKFLPQRKGKVVGMALLAFLRVNPAALAGAALWLGLGGAAAQPLRIATEGSFPPFNWTENGEPRGFEVELGLALCAAMKAECTFVLRDWEELLRGLGRREHDAVMASIEITERRRRRVAFSKPYYRIPATFIGRLDAELGSVALGGLAGRRVGTTVGEHAAFLHARYPEVEVRTYGKLDDAALDLLAGRLDLVLGDKPTMARFLESREGACCRFAGDAPFDPDFYSPGVGVALRKEDQALKERFDRAIDQVRADGTYDAIRRKHFSFRLD